MRTDLVKMQMSVAEVAVVNYILDSASEQPASGIQEARLVSEQLCVRQGLVRRLAQLPVAQQDELLAKADLIIELTARVGVFAALDWMDRPLSALVQALADDSGTQLVADQIYETERAQQLATLIFGKEIEQAMPNSAHS